MKINNDTGTHHKHIPERSCMGCGLKDNKSNFIRLVYDKSVDKIVIDKQQNMSGRSIYICAKKGCYSKMVKRKTLIRFLKKDDLAADAKESLELL